MIYIYKDRKIRLEWTVLKGMSDVAEDFGRALVRVFLVNGMNKTPAEMVSAKDGVLAADVPEGLPEGAYSVECIYIKNMDSFRKNGFDGRCVMRSRKDLVFGITEREDEADDIGEGAVTVSVKTHAATYGYDGLDAYDYAVLSGYFSGTSEEWLEWQCEEIKKRTESLLDELKKRDTRHVVETSGELDGLKDGSGIGDEVYVVETGKTYVLLRNDDGTEWKPNEGGVTVDMSLSGTSENPVANKAVYEAVMGANANTCLLDLRLRVRNGESVVLTDKDVRSLLNALNGNNAIMFTNRNVDADNMVAYAVERYMDEEEEPGTVGVTFYGRQTGMFRLVLDMATKKLTCETDGRFALLTDFASDETAGLIRTGYGQNGKNYPVSMDAETHKAYVNVPWGYGKATADADGLMSKEDKAELDGLERVRQTAAEAKELSGNALMKTKQTLTEQEKSQVKENIGIGTGLRYMFVKVNAISSSVTGGKINLDVNIDEIPSSPVMMVLETGIISGSANEISSSFTVFMETSGYGCHGSTYILAGSLFYNTYVSECDFSGGSFRFTVTLEVGTSFSGIFSVKNVGLLY